MHIAYLSMTFFVSARGREVFHIYVSERNRLEEAINTAAWFSPPLTGVSGEYRWMDDTPEHVSLSAPGVSHDP